MPELSFTTPLRHLNRQCLSGVMRYAATTKVYGTTTRRDSTVPLHFLHLEFERSFAARTPLPEANHLPVVEDVVQVLFLERRPVHDAQRKRQLRPPRHHLRARQRHAVPLHGLRAERALRVE